VALTVVRGVLFGVAPALHASRPDLHSSMKLDSPTTRSRRGGSLRATLVGVQVAPCVVLTVAAGLLLRGLQVADTIDPGFAYRNVVPISLESAFDGHSEKEATARRTRLIADLTALPGVDAIGSADHKPLDVLTASNA
jgi:hypothetical protein